MTVVELIEILRQFPPSAEVRTQFDVNDYDTTWLVIKVRAAIPPSDDHIVLVCA